MAVVAKLQIDVVVLDMGASDQKATSTVHS